MALALSRAPGPAAQNRISRRFAAYWVVVALYLYSIANPTSVDTPVTVTAGTDNPSRSIIYERDETMNNVIAGHFFGLLWNIQFIVYFGLRRRVLVILDNAAPG